MKLARQAHLSQFPTSLQEQKPVSLRREVTKPYPYVFSISNNNNKLPAFFSEPFLLMWEWIVASSNIDLLQQS